MLPALVLLLLLLLLLLCVFAILLAVAAAAAVRHRVTDGKIYCSFVESDSRFFFLFIRTPCIFHVPLGSTVACTASIYLSYNTYYTSSVTAGMRGAKAGISLPRRSPPCILTHPGTHFVSSLSLRGRVFGRPHKLFLVHNGLTTYRIRSLLA